MKKWAAAFCAGLLLILTLSVVPVSAYAAPSVDPDAEASLTLQYRCGGTAFAGLEIQTYRIADVLPDGTYTLTDAFAHVPVSIYGVTSQAEWTEIASTLAAYVAADHMEPTYRGVTDDADGLLCFSGIRPGMYLTLSVRAETEAGTVVFEHLLTCVPNPDEAENPVYDVTVYPKSVVQQPETEAIEYRVVKQWKDSGSIQKRPESITIDLLKDGVLQTTQTLSAKNNWSYAWTAPDDGSKWQAVERNVPAGYTVTIVENGHTIVVTNACGNGHENLPSTGETAAWQPYAIGMGLSGALLLILAVRRKRAEK